ncbi:ecotin family protein [Cyanobium sp. CH-040]|uniref:ecotin family protein n=1 Tax=Cyanobium sp. CH-040 TaxID=2823708 RepID=UPI0020CBB1F4|nr:ecotin family protein [Cyanobium sp. CH-040]MCP9927754.1 ecotin family protein [Cyanobium sp. CH-040]
MGSCATGRTLRFAILPLLIAAAAAPALAIPRLDLKPYPAPRAGETRWVIQLPGVLRSSADPAMSSDPADWRVELIVGKELDVDCNRQLLQGRITPESVPGWGYTVYRVSGGERGLSTLMACPPDQPPRRSFVPLAGEPTLVRYNASLPIVIYAPKHLQVRWRLWKAETGQQEAVRR